MGCLLITMESPSLITILKDLSVELQVCSSASSLLTGGLSIKMLIFLGTVLRPRCPGDGGVELVVAVARDLPVSAAVLLLVVLLVGAASDLLVLAPAAALALLRAPPILLKSVMSRETTSSTSEPSVTNLPLILFLPNSLPS